MLKDIHWSFVKTLAFAFFYLIEYRQSYIFVFNSHISNNIYNNFGIQTWYESYLKQNEIKLKKKNQKKNEHKY